MNPTLKRVLTGLAVGGVVIASVLLAPVGAISAVCGGLAVLALVELAGLVRIRRPSAPGVAAAAFAFFACLLVALFCTLPLIAARCGNLTLLFVIAAVKFSDVGGFAFGHLSAALLPGGNHKMCPKISPGKSWEGFLGSFVFSSLAAAAFIPLARYGRVPPLLLEHGFAAAAAYGLTCAIVGTAGDLAESKLKRWVGVKDSSTMRCTNGLGGLLDMFDSLLLAPLVLLPFL